MSVDKITRQHVLNAVDKIEREGISLTPSTKYNVVINGKEYPPKEIMRHANLIANGTMDWDYNGGEATHKFLKKFGFEIISKDGERDISDVKDMLVEILKRIGKENATIFFDCASQIMEKLDVKQGDIRITCNVPSNSLLVITIGQRYCFACVPNDEFVWGFIYGEILTSTMSINVTKYGGNDEAYYYLCKNANDMLSRLPGIVEACDRELKKTRKSGFNKHTNTEFEQAIFDKEFRKQIFEKAFNTIGNQLINLTGTVWKLGCNWGRYKPIFYGLIKNKSIVLGVHDKLYSIGDLIVITKGQTVWALGKVLEVPKPVTDNPEFEDDFLEFEIDYESWVNYAKVEWYELKDEERFSYQLVQGICRVNSYDIRNKAIEIWNNRFIKPAMNKKIDLAINTILYGPPGTGKTYKLNEYKEAYFIDKNIIKSSEEVLKEKVAAYPFWKVIGAVLGNVQEPLTVGEIVEHPIVQAKINRSIQTKPSQIIWSDLLARAVDESTSLNDKYRRTVRLFQKDDNSKWSIANDMRESLVNVIDQELLEVAANPFSVSNPNPTIQTRYNFITFHQKYSYEDFIEGIKPLLQDENIEGQNGDLQFELKKGIFYNSCLEALKLAGYKSFVECYNDSAENRKAKFEATRNNTSKQFALFIDEINRANISAVFGELITLLEDDKRIGAANEMWIELPYSNEKFSIPANLYVIGTMNTADRSIALLDIALRRRFEFNALYPIYTESEWWSPLLKGLNTAIHNWKKNPDFFIGHAFFISKPETDKSKILNTKIIPLLCEYCQNNVETVKRILAEAGVQIKQPGLENNFQIIAE